MGRIKKLGIPVCDGFTQFLSRVYLKNLIWLPQFLCLVTEHKTEVNSWSFGKVQLSIAYAVEIVNFQCQV